MYRVMIALLVGLMLAGAAFARSESVGLDRLYVFGDSYSDSGAGYVDGNGPTAVVYMARALDIPFTYAGAADAEGKGLNFAVSAAQTGQGAGRRVCQDTPLCGHDGVRLGYGMRNQVDDFLALTRAGQTAWKPETTLFFLAGGLNDGALPTETSVQNLSSEIRDIHAAGGRNFAIGLLPTGIPVFHNVGVRLNPALRHMAEDLRAEFADSHIAVLDWGGEFDRIIQSPAQYGFNDIEHGCAKRAIFGQDPTPCADPAAHFFYHDAHPSTRVHAIVGEALAKQVEKQFHLKPVSVQAP